MGIGKRKGVVCLFATVIVALFLSPSPLKAQTFKHDFLSKFQSRWVDVAVNSASTRIFLINESYSRIEEYNTAGVLQAIHGSFGTGSTQLNRPQGMVMDSTDHLYVTDTGNNRIVKCDATGAVGAAITCTALFGSSGTTTGQFSSPHSISTDNTYLFIADTGNNRIQRCTMDGVTCTAWGQLGNANGRYSSPQGITYNSGDGNVYVADTGNNRIQVITNDASGTFLSSFGSYGTSVGQYAGPFRIIADSADHLFIMDTASGGRIQKVDDSTHTQFTVFSLPTTGTGMAINGTVLYVSELNTVLEKYNLNTSSLTSTLSNQEIGRPVDMTIDSANNIYINNNLNENAVVPSPVPVIQKFDSNFVQQNEWTGSTGGLSSTSTTGPMGMGVNTGNDIYVADTNANKLQKYASLTSDWADVPTPAAPVGAYNSPKDVATEATGKYYVADTGNSRVVKYDPGYGFITWQLATPTPGGPTIFPSLTPAPYGITIASDNTIYVADYGYSRIQSFDANGTFLRSWGEFGSADNSTIPQLDRPQGMAIDSNGYIFVADTYNSRVQRFDQTGALANRTVWGTFGAGDGQFNVPRNVAVDAQSHVYVSEVGNKRIQVFGDAASSAGLTVTQSNGTTIAEGATSTDSAYLIDSYTVRLNTQPSTTVYVAMAVSDTSQASLSSSQLIFTPYNWYIPQTVTVTPINDHISNGTHTVIITHKPSSTDTNYQNVAQTSWSDVTVTINDTIDIPQVTLSSHNISGTEGTFSGNAYSVVLNTKPTSNVVITVVPESTVLVSPTTLTFTSTNWSTPQYVGIQPVHDYVATGTHTANINHTVSSSDTNYGSSVAFSGGSANVVTTITDIDTAGVTVYATGTSTPKTTVTVTENGATDSFAVNLTSRPTADVQIDLADTTSTALVTFSPSSLIFTASTWNPNSPQSVTVTAVHDYIKNPVNPRSTQIEFTTSSDDTNYNAYSISNINTNVTDTDIGGLIVYRPSGGTVTVTEGGATDTYLMRLSSIPTANVTITTTNTDGYATTSAYLYTFTPSNWDTPQYATVSAVNDSVVQGTHSSAIIHTLSSADTNFTGTTTLGLSVVDNDTVGISVRLPDGVVNIAEAGPTDTYYVKLSSQPTANVLLTFSANGQATASPATLTFTSGNWDTEQSVVISAIEDYIVEGPMTQTITYTASSSDTGYNGQTTTFTANIADDDSLSPGVNFIETNGGTEVIQNSTTDSYTMTLTSKPTANVKVKIVTSNNVATTSAGIYWFTASNWNIPQTVTVQSRSTPNLSSDATALFTHLLTSSDPHYNNLGVATVTVTVRVNRSSSSSSSTAKPPSCGSTPPYEAPNLFQVTTNQTQATLYFTPILSNLTYFFIAYGYTPGDLRFGASYEYGPYPGVVNYTVNMLAPGTTYYFMVRGGNGCATGPWSASVAATTVSADASAQATRTFYAPVTPTTSGSGSTSGSGYTFGRDLYPGSQGADVRALQQYLNAKGFVLASSGAGSPGNETDYYGSLTAAAVRRFQEAHFQEILNPLGYGSGTGIFGPSTRTYVNSHP